MLLITTILISANLFIYWQVRSFQFIGWDDPLYVTQNEQVLKGISWEGFRWAMTSSHAANWHPLTWLSLMLDVQLFGAASGSIHSVNVIFHVANTLLLFLLLFRMSSALGKSAFVAALFAVHPLHVESVAWVAERKDVLSTFFLLLTILAYTAFVRKSSLKNYLMLNGLFLLALMAKPIAVTLPVLLLLLDIWPLGRVNPQGAGRRAWRRCVLEKLPLVGISALVCLVTLLVQRKGGTVAGFEAFPLASRAANALYSTMVYLLKMLWPADLSAFYPYQPLSALTVVMSGLGLIGISIAAMKLSASQPFVLVGWLWYLAALFPVIGLIQVGDQARADRYTYLPLIGIAIIIAWGIPKLLAQHQRIQPGLVVAASLIICSLSIWARVQTSYWKDAYTLWNRAVKVTRNNAHSHVNLGFALMERGEVRQAAAHYQQALRIRPDFAEAHNAMGVAVLAQGRVDEAGAHFAQALRLKPRFLDARINMGSALARKGKTAEAILFFTQALVENSGDAKLHYNIGLALTEIGKYGEASSHYSEAIRIRPDFTEPYVQLGNLLLNQDQLDQAVEQYRTAIRLGAKSVAAHNNLGIALMHQGRLSDAISECDEALRINPDFAPARNCMGDALVLAGRKAEAMVEYRHALHIDPDNTDAYQRLAKVLIDEMRDEEAIALLNEALRILPDFTEAHMNLAIALINKGREQEAVGHLRKVLLEQPGHQAAKNTLAIAMQRQRPK